MPSVQTRQLASGETRYFVRVRDPKPRPGKSGFTSATYATRPEAERFVRDCKDRGVAFALAEYHREQGEADELTLDEWAAIHFDSLTEASKGTIKRYRKYYAECWSPLLGHMRLSEIERTDVATALNKVTGADKTVKNKWAVLTDMLKKAAMDGKIERTPTLGVKPGRQLDHEVVEHRYLTHGEFKAILHATPEYWQPLVLMLVGTGMRWGEMAALTVADVDLESGTVRITKAEKQDPDVPTRTYVGPTKSKKSRRTITMPAEVVEAVRPLVEKRGGKQRLFLPPRGGPLRHRTFYRDIWQRKCLRLDSRTKLKEGEKRPAPTVKEPYPRLHDLRHTHVAWLIAAGVSLPVIQARLGHESIRTTIDTYGHLLPDLQRQAAEAANVVLDGMQIAPHELE